MSARAASAACLLCTLLAAPRAGAQPCTEERALTVVYGNGMFTTEAEAETAKWELAAALGPLGGAETRTSFEVAYNHDEAVLAQLFEVARMRAGEEAIRLWRMLAGLELAPDWLRDELLRLATERAALAPREDDDIARHVARYQQLLADGSRVIVVAHSQGNLYANAAYAALAQAGTGGVDGLGVVAVATPATHVAGTASYVTLSQDLVIAAVRAFYPSTLPSNLDIGAEPTELLGHGFIDAYLRAPSAQAQVVELVHGLEAWLVPPAAAVQPPPSDPAEACMDATAYVEAAPDECPPETWADTCVEDYFASCWDGRGSCESDFTLDGAIATSTIQWSNGAHITTTQLLGARQGRSQVVAASGEVCATGTVVLRDDPACISSSSLRSSEGNLFSCIDARGTISVKCPNGVTITRVAGASCFLGGRQACDADTW